MMQIELRNPYIPQTATKVDVKDFCHIDIHIEGQHNVNHYLLSLWHQFDIALHPEHSSRVPWYYAPARINGKSSNFYYFGNINTRLGNFAVGMMAKKKGDIDSLHFYSFQYTPKQLHRIFKPLIDKAAQEIDTLTTYYSIAALTTSFEGLKIANYQGQNFTTFTEDGKMKISFKVKAIDRYEALRQSKQRIDYLLSFLAIETNLCKTRHLPNVRKQGISHRSMNKRIMHYQSLSK